MVITRQEKSGNTSVTGHIVTCIGHKNRKRIVDVCSCRSLEYRRMMILIGNVITFVVRVSRMAWFCWWWWKGESCFFWEMGERSTQLLAARKDFRSKIKSDSEKLMWGWWWCGEVVGFSKRNWVSENDSLWNIYRFVQNATIWYLHSKRVGYIHVHA